MISYEQCFTSRLSVTSEFHEQINGRMRQECHLMVIPIHSLYQHSFCLFPSNSLKRSLFTYCFFFVIGRLTFPLFFNNFNIFFSN